MGVLIIDRCRICGGNMVQRESATLITVACDRKCGAFYTKKKKA
jgi:hypothetical protein